MPNGLTGDKRIEMTELVATSVVLSEYDEDTQREYFDSLAHIYKNAKVGSAQFREICQGRAEGPAKSGKLFSTCGEWAHFLLARAGYRGPALNRNLFDEAGKTTRSWVDQKNITYLFNGMRKEGAFTEYLLSKQKSRRPSCGDICYISIQGRPLTEHVFMFEGVDSNPGSPYEYWTSFDGGQGGITDQHIAEVHRVFDQRTGMLYGVHMDASGKYIPRGEGRPLIGWVNIALLPFTAPANLRSV